MSDYLLLERRSETEARAEIRAHQVKRLVELEQEADRYERLSLTLTDRTARAEALRLSVETAARAIRVRNAVALTNFLVPPSADDRGREDWSGTFQPVSGRNEL